MSTSIFQQEGNTVALAGYSLMTLLEGAQMSRQTQNR